MNINANTQSCTIAELPGHPVLFGLTVLQQRAGVAAVPGVVGGSEESVQPEDQIHPRAAAEGVQQVHSGLCDGRTAVITPSR